MGDRETSLVPLTPNIEGAQAAMGEVGTQGMKKSEC